MGKKGVFDKRGDRHPGVQRNETVRPGTSMERWPASQGKRLKKKRKKIEGSSEMRMEGPEGKDRRSTTAAAAVLIMGADVTNGSGLTPRRPRSAVRGRGRRNRS